MLPTLNVTGSMLLVERISTRSGKLRPGDVVIFRSPETPRKIVCKRLIGLEGDQITYVVDPQSGDRCETIVVPKGHVWVEGDYIYNTKDSRNFGALPYGLLEGRAFWTLPCMHAFSVKLVLFASNSSVLAWKMVKQPEMSFKLCNKGKI
ncbi:Mitochondrial inner membrane protease subunit 1 [Gossypium australe]|uniref:Mitochondrial inner membrane protease subunit 1 n=1 Tax=Gossypium australe TaxID=47621 RepID=A0A5B6U5P0_9ROSI|nr:Mitochondrial inner membrane protease subunit 1 [Gossypium australe]